GLDFRGAQGFRKLRRGRGGEPEGKGGKKQGGRFDGGIEGGEWFAGQRQLCGGPLRGGKEIALRPGRIAVPHWFLHP
ncbi:MAG: hypothetical protein ABUL65_03610, partial [Opitutus sp.]